MVSDMAGVESETLGNGGDIEASDIEVEKEGGEEERNIEDTLNIEREANEQEEEGTGEGMREGECCGNDRHRDENDEEHRVSVSSDLEEERDENDEDAWEDVEDGETDDNLSFEDPHEETSENKQAEETETGMGCAHYRRKCKIVSPCCGDIFWCRHCHNEVKSDGERDYRKSHELDRTAVTEIVCSVCETRQPVSNKCMQCDITFATYFCNTCKFWDDEGLKKGVYHCDECGLCRTGGRENYFHCKVCGSCYSTAIRDSHKCVEKAMHQPCPICCENMFTSVRQVHVLKCGHTLHADCLQQLHSECLGLQALRCPLCCKSLGDYGRIWERLDEEVARTPLPDELRRKATAICNDCGARSQVDYHIVGLKCGSCGGYNTREMNA